MKTGHIAIGSCGWTSANNYAFRAYVHLVQMIPVSLEVEMYQFESPKYNHVLTVTVRLCMFHPLAIKSRSESWYIAHSDPRTASVKY